MKLLALALPQYFCQTVNPITTNDDALKIKARLKMLLAAFPFLPWRLKVEIKRVYEIADHAVVLPPIFCQTVNPISTKGTRTPNLMI